MKMCSTCKYTLPLSSFGKRTRSADGLNPVCRSCRSAEARLRYCNDGAKQRERGRERYEERRARLDALKDVPCADCGERFPAVCMDFDHVRGTKVANISVLLVRATWEALIAEIEKCDVVCANCHRIRTWVHA